MIAGVVLLAIGVGVLYAFLPGLVESPAVRERIEQAARDATGREFRYEALSFGLFPPRLRVEDPVLAGEKEGDPPFAEAREVSLRVAFWPLLARSLVLENLVVHGATVRLVRDADGLRLPEPVPEEKQDAASGERRERAPSSDAETESDGDVALAVKELALRDARVILEDRTVSPAATWDLSELDATAALSPDAPVELDLGAKLGGGSLRLDGTADLPEETADFEASFDGVGLKLIGPYLSGRRELSGALSGTLKAKGAFANPALEADLRVADGVVRISDVGLEGPLSVRADLADGAGSFDVDATAAALDAYEGAFQKPAGKPGSVKGRFVPKEGGGVRVDDLELKIHNLDARGSVETGAGDRVQAELTAEPFELAGWEEILPQLAEYNASGTLRPGTLRVATEPLSVHGRIGLDGIRMELPDGPALGLEGAIEGTGDALKLHDVALTTAGEVLRVGGEIRDLAEPRKGYHLSLNAEGAESNTLLSAFTAVDDRVYGPLFLSTDLTGRTADPALGSVAGTMSFALRPGRLKGVSILEKTVGRLGTFGEAALLAAALEQPERVKKLERFYGDDFKELAGTFDVAQGWARTNDLRLIYDDYRVDLVGGIRLRDRRLDFSGTLTIDPEVDAALADASGGSGAGEKRVIQLAEVKGTLDSPKVGLSSRTVRAWVGGYAGHKVRDKYQDELDEKLGEELGGDVGEIVEGILGGRR